MKKLLLLGGDNCQRSAAKYAQEQGIQVFLADYTRHPPAARYAEKHFQVSSFDVAACTQAARQCGAQGIMTIGTDQPVYTAACVSRALGLPSPISVETALAVTNKKVMKQKMTAAGIPTVPYCFLQPGDSADCLKALHPPYVIKPLDSQGQRGIFKLDSPPQVLAHLAETLRYSRCSSALVENFYESDEVTVSGWVQQGRLFILTITDRLLYPDKTHIGVCIGHRFPSIHMDKAHEMRQICERLCTACGIENGPLYVQLLVGAQGIVVNELACRIGGAFEDFFIPYITDFSILDAVIRASLGLSVDVSPLAGYDVTRATKKAATQLLFCKSGRVAACTGEKELRRLPYVLDAGFNYHPGDTVPVMENATARFGHAVLAAPSQQEIKAVIQDFYERFQVKDEKGQNMVTRLYPEA